MKSSKEVLIVGGTGFLGSAIGENLSQLGYGVRILTRQLVSDVRIGYACTPWTWDGKTIPPQAILGVHAVINLAGSSIADHRWSPFYKEQILKSRVNSVQAVIAAIGQMDRKPDVVVQASAIGYYGALDHKVSCDESSAPGGDFLAGVCTAWENAAAPLANQTRLVIPRIGVVLGWEGGAFPKLWSAYSWGLGCTFGDGRQWSNWIHIFDLVRFFEVAIQDSNFRGVYNLVAPENTNNKTFHKILCKYTWSLTSLRAPSFALDLALGSRKELLTKGPRVKPSALLAKGFSYNFPKIEDAISDLLTSKGNPKAKPVFLKAQWRNLVMINYSIDSSLLSPFLPVGTELDIFDGNCFLSLVCFQFLNTKVKGIPIPLHGDFDEINLRFYVKRKRRKAWERGVVFIKEFVPRAALAWVANAIYNENYQVARMKSYVVVKDGFVAFEHSWKTKSSRNSEVKVRAVGVPATPGPGSIEEFITQHYFGYAVQRDGSTKEYEVKHPAWRVWNQCTVDVDVDFSGLYGKAFAFLETAKPASVFVAEGSEVTVHQASDIYF